jgi:hypothetical protein
MRLQLIATASAVLVLAWDGLAEGDPGPAPARSAPGLEAAPAPGGPGVAPAASEAAAPTGPSPVGARVSAHTTFYADSDHVTVVTPVVTAEVGDPYSTWHARGEYLVDVISAASVDIVSTASQRWQEVRQAGALDAGYRWKRFGARASAAVSAEPDYRSFAGGGDFTWDLADRNHTLLLGYALDHDTIGRTGTSFDVFSRTLLQHSLNAGITLTLNRAAVLSIVSDLFIERGDQSKPYRYVPMFAPDVAPTIEKGASIDTVNAKRLPERPLEHLPESRERYALTGRFGYRFAHGTLRIDERLYADTWALHASTTEVRYFIDLSKRFTVFPHLRGHVQNGTYFFRRAYVSMFSGTTAELPRYRTGDRELGPLATLTAGAGASFGIGPSMRPSAWTLELQTDFIGTEFLDDLYVKSRAAVLVAGGIVGVFE